MIIRKTINEEDIAQTTKALVELAGLAMKFGRIDRTCVVHPDGTPESDTDHTVMVGWVACALAEYVNFVYGYEKYPVGKVAQYSFVHDAPEVYAGDTQTLRITEEEYAAKEVRETKAANQLFQQFRRTLPWFARTVSGYESQMDPVARFVRSVDKLVPKLVHVLNAAKDLVAFSVTHEEFLALVARQRTQITGWCPEPVLLQLYDALAAQVNDLYPAASRHFFVGRAWRMDIEHPKVCVHVTEGVMCAVDLAFAKQLGTPGGAAEIFEKQGRWEVVALGPEGEERLGFNGKQEN